MWRFFHIDIFISHNHVWKESRKRTSSLVPMTMKMVTYSACIIDSVKVLILDRSKIVSQQKLPEIFFEKTNFTFLPPVISV